SKLQTCTVTTAPLLISLPVKHIPHTPSRPEPSRPASTLAWPSAVLLRNLELLG
ncbi:hypothetical protein PROFUN_17123, partial [Planoprotostelium fungivorum]